MNCRHKPRNTLLIQYDSENGLHFCGKNERCRFCGSKIKLKRRWLFALWAVLLWCLPVLPPLIAVLLFDVNLYSSWTLFRWLAPIAALIYFFEGSVLFCWETDPLEEHIFEKKIDGLSMENRETRWDDLKPLE